LALGACDIPTSAPKIESRFVFPSDSVSLSVNSLLPANQVTAAGANFQLTVPAPAPFARTLGQMCGVTCTALNGASVPKPAFSDSFAIVVAMPAEVTSAVIVSGAVNVVIANNLGFDVLQPAGSVSTGTMVITARNGTTVLGSATVLAPFPNGTQKTVSVPIAAGTVTGPINISVAFSSPAGTTPVVINTNNSIAVTVTPAPILISSATVQVANKAVTASSSTLGLGSIDKGIADRVLSGAFLLTITNPFGVSGTMTMSITCAPTNNDPENPCTISPAITRPVQISASPTSTTRVEFSGEDLKKILGHDVNVVLSGTVSGTNNSVTVQPGQVLGIKTKVDVIIQVTGTVTP
jgi:hypothetical protein